MFPLGTKIRNKKNNKIGVVVSDIMSCCDETEVPIEYEGTSTFQGTDISIIEDLGLVNPQPNFSACGAGKMENCCIFLTVGPQGISCERFSSLRNSLMFKTMSAKRQPTEAYPNCKNQ